MNEDKAEDLTSVLRNLGYKKVEAQQRCRATIERYPDEEVPLEVLIKEALAWTHPPAGVMKAQQVATQTQPTDVPVIESLPPSANPLMTARFVWEAGEEPELETSDGSTSWVVVGATIGVLVGGVLWFGVVRSLMVLAGLLTFFYFLGKTVGSKTPSLFAGVTLLSAYLNSGFFQVF